MAFIGHLNDPVKLSGMGIGNLVVSLVSIGPYWGLNGALETLVSQTSGGRNIQLCGIYLHRGRIINFFCFIPMVILYLFSFQILIALGQDPEVSATAYLYILTNMPSVLLIS